jgi:hypothetical protein
MKHDAHRAFAHHFNNATRVVRHLARPGILTNFHCLSVAPRSLPDWHQNGVNLPSGERHLYRPPFPLKPYHYLNQYMKKRPRTLINVGK